MYKKEISIFEWTLIELETEYRELQSQCHPHDHFSIIRLIENQSFQE